ncbi:MAG: sensor histidine kinase [Rubrivivax sp.]
MGSHTSLSAQRPAHVSVDPWAMATTTHRPGGPLAWLLPLSVCLMVAATVSLLLYRTPSSLPVENAADVAISAGRVEQALRLLARDPGAPREELGTLAETLDHRVAALQSQLDREAIEAPELSAFASAWAALRTQLRQPSELGDALVASGVVAKQASALVPGVRRHLDQRRANIELALKALLAALALALAMPLHALWRQRRRMRSSLHQFSDELGSGTWRDAVHHLREDPQGAPSAFDALASGVESVLGESDRRWQALADLSADWYWETDRQYRLSWLSGSAPQAMVPGWDAAALLGRRHDQIAPFRPPAEGWAALHERMARFEPFRDVEFQLSALRQTRWLAISGRPRRDAAGVLIGYEGVGRDITERRNAHEQLIASEQRWSMMARLAADWYWQTDAEHRVLPLSPEQHQRVGAFLAEQVEGRTRWDAHRDSLTPAQWDEHRADLEARRPFRSLQFEINAGDGRWLWISISGLPRFDGAQRFIGYHGVGRDITTRKQAEAVLLRHNEALQRAVHERTRELQQRNLDLDAFARQLAHELRTPIGHVQGLAHLLADRGATRLNAEDQELLGLQVQAAHRMRDMVDALMALARSTLQPLPMQALDLSALAHEVVDELPVLPRKAPLRWDIQCDMRVTANPAALKIVLANLMGNAAKFTRDGATPRARVGLRAEAGERLRVSVQDNGVGFDPQRASQLFRPFSRLHGRDDYAGSGIGLSIVQRIVERHGGAVAASATPGQGACFEFTLPCAAEAKAPTASNSEHALML